MRWAEEAKRPQAVEQVMLRNFMTASPGTTLGDAESLMRVARLRHLVVVEDGIVVGLISHRAILDASLAALRRDLGRRDADILGTRTIQHMVREEPVTISPEGSLEAAASRMLALRLGCLPVAIPSPRGPQLLGLVTEAGLLRAAYLPAPPGPRG
jgi:CBS domain-containing protein